MEFWKEERTKETKKETKKKKETKSNLRLLVNFDLDILQTELSKAVENLISWLHYYVGVPVGDDEPNSLISVKPLLNWDHTESTTILTQLTLRTSVKLNSCTSVVLASWIWKLYTSLWLYHYVSTQLCRSHVMIFCRENPWYLPGLFNFPISLFLRVSQPTKKGSRRLHSFLFTEKKPNNYLMEETF